MNVISKNSLKTIAVVILLAQTFYASNAKAALIEASYDFYITQIQGNTALFDTWTDVNSVDLYVGQKITAHIQIDTVLAPADSDASADIYASVFNNFSTIGAVTTRFLTTSMSIGGNIFEPATMTLPLGVQTANSDPAQSDNANQWLYRNNDLFGIAGLTSLNVFDDWDTEFDGILHDRQLSIGLYGCDFADAVPLTNEELSSCQTSQTIDPFGTFTSGGSMWVRAGDGLLEEGSQNVGGFQFSAASPIPEPPMLVLMVITLLWLKTTLKHRAE